MAMRARLKLASVGISVAIALAACGGGSESGSPAPNSSAQSTLNFVVTDTPSTGITVLSFQIEITGAVLQPGNVSILPKPVTVDLAQLVSDTGFLSSSVIDSATYSSLTLTFANPQLTIQNNTGVTLTLGGQPCSPGATCTFMPALDDASLAISSGVFPLTLTANASTGLNLDLSIPDLLQSDLSVTFANGNSVNLSLLPDAPIRIDDMLATVSSVGGNQLNVTTAFGDALVLNEGSDSSYKYPQETCASDDATCVMAGQVVAVDASLGSDGTLIIDSLSYLGSTGAPLVKALVLSSPASSSSSVAVLLQRGLNVPSLTFGELANVTLASNSTYSVATAAYPSVPSASFASPADLLPGQELILSVGSVANTGGVASFTTSSVFLNSSQVFGDVATLSSGTASLSIDSLTGLFTAPGLHIESIDVQTDSTTVFVGAGALTDFKTGQIVVAKGPLFNVPGSSSPALAAVQIAAR